jgi:hypothetical protein
MCYCVSRFCFASSASNAFVDPVACLVGCVHPISLTGRYRQFCPNIKGTNGFLIPVTADWKVALGITDDMFASEWQVPKQASDMIGQERHWVQVGKGAHSEVIVPLDEDTHTLTNPNVVLRIRVEGINKAASKKTCLSDHDNNGICEMDKDVTTIYSGIFRFTDFATCGDLNGQDKGVLCGARFSRESCTRAYY